MKNCDTLRAVYLNELRHLFSAEAILLQSWPSISAKVVTPALRELISKQVGKTQIHLSRLEQIFKDLSETAADYRCQAMAAMVAEVRRYGEASGDHDVRDAAIISATRKIHHYKGGAYATVCTLASRLGDPRVAKQFRAMQRDERAADHQLAKIADNSVNVNAGNPAKAKTELDVSIF